MYSSVARGVALINGIAQCILVTCRGWFEASLSSHNCICFNLCMFCTRVRVLKWMCMTSLLSSYVLKARSVTIGEQVARTLWSVYWERHNAGEILSSLIAESTVWMALLWCLVASKSLVKEQARRLCSHSSTNSAASLSWWLTLMHRSLASLS